ncbi:putative 18S rRNA (guanine-N(7))-methyltransferase [Porphyridium purpureum]|uniref:Putative 18S rRNA (Guanine-N(7))-methyltransferase n=1 Tax=Porphyridium purpureum TaxID=35688 RepID=A0A5J4YNR2_PORPP|nr:putative 18S rRNA (guanine-N(7))-methyltransferase [Porphyridium purpureum]|eukprot:POR2454..scf295_9
MSRPEHVAPPEVFYNESEAKKYLMSSRMIEIQAKLANRCLELLALPEDGGSKLLLDIGCGTGLSGDVLSESGHIWVGTDISPAMLDVALERDAEGDLFQADAGDGMFFRNGVFDGAISVSVLQWLCNADSSNVKPRKRLLVFFETLYACLYRGSRAVFQFYPENESQMELISASAMRAGFTGGIIVDYPHSTRAKKIYLCLRAGPALPVALQPKALLVGDGEHDPQQAGRQHVEFSKRRERPKKAGAGKLKKGGARGSAISKVDSIHALKERQRRQGHDVKLDSRYTGKKRSKKF